MSPAVKSARSKKKATQADGKIVQSSKPAEVKEVDWPSIDAEPWKADDLHLVHLVPGQIVTIPNYWSASLCKKYVTFLKTLPLVTTPGVPRRGEAVRMNDRFQIDDPTFADSLWNSGLKHMILHASNYGPDGDDTTQLEKLWGGDVVGLSPNIRIYRYSKGQFFDKHYDETNHLTHPGPPHTPAHTTWTLLLYLTTPTSGGETIFYPEALGKRQSAPDPVLVMAEAGTALLHRHGRECMLHEGREVVGGEKWVIRSDLCVRG